MDAPSTTASNANGSPAAPDLPPHIDATVRAIAKLHLEHHRGASPTERIVERLAGLVARPRFIAYAASAMLAWALGNVAAFRLGWNPLDRPPFPWLDTFVSISALFITTIILISQRREDQLSNLREQLTLELAILSEQKSAKTIQLLEELRRDSPVIPNRVDREAEEMAKPADPESVLMAIVDTQAEAKLLDQQSAPDSPVPGSSK